MKDWLPLVFFALTACVSQPSGELRDAKGQVRYEVECLNDEKFCEPEAQKLCPDGYRVVDEDSGVVAIWRGVDVVNKIRFYLTIECE